MLIKFILVLCIIAVVSANGSRSLSVKRPLKDAGDASSPFWPQPTSFSLGTSQLKLDSTFSFKQTQSETSQLLQRGMERYQKIYDKYHHGRQNNNSGNTIQSCNINVNAIFNNPSEEKATLDLNVDESYSISINEDGICDIKSATVWGALHALETFTQLLTRIGDDGKDITMNYAPVSVSNYARFAHRGVLLDSARHYLPIETLKTMIDSLPMANFNVMHWHVEDAQSFPLDTPSSPAIIKGAFQPSDVYTMEQVKDLDNYATDRGVRIVYEIDGPGHTASWSKGYPELISEKCIAKYAYNVNDYAVNPTIEKTYEVLHGILKDIKKATNTKYIHLGGDEVVYGCWELDSQITQFMEDNNIATYPDLLGYYVEKAEEIAVSLGTDPIQWEDTFIAGIRPPPNAIFDVWTNSSQIAAVTAAGYRVIAAPQNYWYLDHSDNTWQVMYGFDPTEGADMSSAQKELIVGGETSMWGEKVDQYNIQSKVWPTAAAVGERLWSAMNNTDPAFIDDATARLNTFICRMNNRGFYAGPINPGYCATEYV